MSWHRSFCLCLSIVLFQVTVNAANGTLKVTSFPNGAEVLVDSVSTNKVTPMNISLSEGDHVVTVRISGSGWQVDTRTVTILPGNNDLSITLIPSVTQGPSGPMGPAGSIGPVGPPGATGGTGPAGPIGVIGPVGQIGASGPAGPIGVIGPAGPIGATGPAGPIGVIGPVGQIGASGPAGPIGATGSAGPIGATGPAGPGAGYAAGFYTGPLNSVAANIATLRLPAGAYLLFANVGVANRDTSREGYASCQLLQNGSFNSYRTLHLAAAGAPGDFGNMSIGTNSGVLTEAETVFTLSCLMTTGNGTFETSFLGAVKVGTLSVQ